MELPVLSVNQLRIEVAGKTLVESISFDLYPGKCLAIVGESGSGKTLSCLTLLQLNPKSFNYSSGQIIDHRNHKQLSPTDTTLMTWRGKRVAMIFQEPMSALNPSMRVGEQVAEAIIFHLRKTKQEAHQDVIALFKEVRLPDPEVTFNKYPHQLSGGQRQRVMIAMALIE